MCATAAIRLHSKTNYLYQINNDYIWHLLRLLNNSVYRMICEQRKKTHAFMDPVCI